MTTKTSVTPDRLGAFDVRCAELCGLLHADMETSVHVVTPADFLSWLRANGRAADGATGRRRTEEGGSHERSSHAARRDRTADRRPADAPAQRSARPSRAALIGGYLVWLVAHHFLQTDEPDTSNQVVADHHGRLGASASWSASAPSTAR